MHILREPEVISRTGLSSATIWRYERAGNFPTRLRLGKNSVGWLQSEIDEWIATRSRGRLSYKDLNINSSEVPA
jgi:prophage regulatory protein